MSPATGWLEGSGLELADGLVCDETLRAVGAPGVWAAGDVARWTSPRYGGPVRVEHWTNAADQGMAVARNLLAEDGSNVAFDAVPYVWSHQYGVRIQIVGRCRPDDEVRVVQGSLEDGRFLAAYGRDGQVEGAVAFDLPGPVMRLHRRLADGVAWDDVATAAEATS